MTNAARKLQPAPVREAEFEFDLDNITLDHAEQFEDETGRTVDEAFGPRVALMPDGTPVFNRAGEPVFVRRYSAKDLKILLKIVNPALDVHTVKLAQLGEPNPGRKLDPTEQPDEPKSVPDSPPSGE